MSAMTRLHRKQRHSESDPGNHSHEHLSGRQFATTAWIRVAKRQQQSRGILTSGRLCTRAPLILNTGRALAHLAEVRAGSQIVAGHASACDEL